MKKILFVVGMCFWALGGERGYAAGATVMAPSAKNIPTVQTAPVKTGTVAPLFPGAVPMNPVIQSIQNTCNDAKKLVDSCNLCQSAKDQAKAQCDAEKLQQAASQNTQCDGDVSESLQSGTQLGWSEAKGRAPKGYVFPSFSSESCESFCSRVKDRDGHLMTCISSFTVTGGCLSDARMHPGSCQASGEGVQCFCI